MSDSGAYVCKHCGEKAPHADERFSWLGWHDSFAHRLAWNRFTRRFLWRAHR